MGCSSSTIEKALAQYPRKEINIIEIPKPFIPFNDENTQSLALSLISNRNSIASIHSVLSLEDSYTKLDIRQPNTSMIIDVQTFAMISVMPTRKLISLVNKAIQAVQSPINLEISYRKNFSLTPPLRKTNTNHKSIYAEIQPMCESKATQINIILKNQLVLESTKNINVNPTKILTDVEIIKNTGTISITDLEEHSLKYKNEILDLQKKLKLSDDKNSELERLVKKLQNIPTRDENRPKTQTISFVKALKNAQKKNEAETLQTVKNPSKFNLNKSTELTPRTKESVFENEMSVIPKQQQLATPIGTRDKDLFPPKTSAISINILDMDEIDVGSSSEFFNNTGEPIKGNLRYKRNLIIKTPKENLTLSTPIQSARSSKTFDNTKFNTQSTPFNKSMYSSPNNSFTHKSSTSLKQNLLDSEKKRHLMALKIYQKNQTSPKDNLSKLIDEIIYKQLVNN